MVGIDFIYNCYMPINNIIQIILSKVLTTFTIYGFTHFNSFLDFIHTFFLLQLLFPYIVDYLLSLIIKNCDQNS